MYGDKPTDRVECKKVLLKAIMWYEWTLSSKDKENVISQHRKAFHKIYQYCAEMLGHRGDRDCGSHYLNMHDYTDLIALHYDNENVDQEIFYLRDLEDLMRNHEAKDICWISDKYLLGEINIGDGEFSNDL